MALFSFGSLRAKLIFLVLIAVIPALILTFYTGLEVRRHARLDALDEALEIARKISDDQERLIEKTHQLLVGLAKMDQVLQCPSSGYSPFLASLLKEYPFYTNLGTTGPDGQVICSALPMKHPVNFADREWFTRTLHTRKFTVSEYLIGRITGKPSIVLSYPILAGTDHLKAVVFASLDLTWFHQSIVRTEMPPGSVVRVFDRKGTILATYPDPEKWVGRNLSDTPIVKTVLTRQEEGTVEIAGIDGILRLYAFTPLSDRKEVGAYVAVGIPSAVAFAEANRILFRNLALLILVTILALVAAWWFGGFFIMSPVNRLLNTTKRLADGDLTVRTGSPYLPGEIGQLAQSFDQMAESLEQREAERKQAEEDLRKSEARLQLQIDRMPIGCIMWDPEFRVQSWNPAAQAIFGFTVEEMMGKHPYGLIVPKEVQSHVDSIWQCLLEGDSTAHSVNENMTKDGRTIVCEWSNTPIKEADGRVMGVLSMVQDITKRKRAEEEVQLLQSITFAIGEAGDVHSALKIVLQKVCEATGWVIGEAWVPNSDGTYLECSPAWYSRVEGLEKFRKECEKFTFPPGIGLPGRVWSSKKPVWVENVTLDSNFPRAAIAKEVGFKTAMAIPVLAGDEIVAVIDFFLFESRKEDERLLEIVSSVAAQLGSLIQRKRMEHEKRVLEEQFRQSQKMEAIGRLAGGIAHDFNNLLTIIKGYSQLSLMELKEGNPLKPNIEEIQKAADRAAALTRQLLAFSRRQVLEMRVLDLNTILRDLEKMLRRVIGEDIDLAILLSENLGTVKADPGQIEQVVMNLAVNARDAMLKGGKLTIETANVELDENYARNHVAVTPGSYVMLSVSDTGVGMPPEVKERIFEPFFTTKEKGKGTGLGLSTVYGIVKQSGGNIWVYSEPGQGTTFKIYLPRVDEPLEEPGERVVQKELPGGGETILVVEDEEKLRQVTVQILTKNGYTVLEASHGDEARQICEQHGGPIHLIVTDVVLPGMNGRELAESLVSRHPGAKVLYMSGYTDNAIVHHGVLEKGLSFLQKPFNLEDLLRKVREVLEK